MALLDLGLGEHNTLAFGVKASCAGSHAESRQAPQGAESWPTRRTSLAASRARGASWNVAASCHSF